MGLLEAFAGILGARGLVHSRMMVQKCKKKITRRVTVHPGLLPIETL
jgi:hypothetical protein